MNSDQRTVRWPWRTTAVLSPLPLIVLIVFSVMNVIQQRRARALLLTMAHFQIGRTSSVEILKLAGSFDFDTEASAWMDDVMSSRIGRQRLNECEKAACSIDIVLLLPGQYIGKDWFPRRNKVVSRFIPQKMLFARFGVKQGVLTRVSALLESHNGQPDYPVAVVMGSSEGTAESEGTPRWVEEKSGQFMGGLWGGGHYNSVNVYANQFVPLERVTQMFDFNPKCLRLWTHCSACEMLKSACTGVNRVE